MPYDLATTAIIRTRKGNPPEDKFLIVKRHPSEKRFPGKWAVPGGKLEPADYENLPKDTEECWYNVIEKVLEREVRTETGIEIANITYLTSIVSAHGGAFVVISCTADHADGEVTLQPEELTDYAWVTAEEAKTYDLIDGIYDELVLAEKHFRGEKAAWTRNGK